MPYIHVGVLRGGISGEHEVSLQTGEAVLRNLGKQYHPLDIVIDKYGEWFLNGAPQPHDRIFSVSDVIWNALHGYHGEDGKVQKILDHHQIPYTGSGVIPSALGMNKALSKNIFEDVGLKTPDSIVLHQKTFTQDLAVKIFREFSHPFVVKPIDGGSSLGVYITQGFEGFLECAEKAFERSFKKSILVEEYIKGREATCGVIDHFRNERYYALPPVEIIPPSEHDFFDNDAKYSGATREVCPGNFSRDEKNEIMRMAVEAHRALGLRHYSRSDFIVSPRGIYILEVNTLPGLTEESLFPKAVRAVGCSFPGFLDHVTSLALSRM